MSATVLSLAGAARITHAIFHGYCSTAPPQCILQSSYCSFPYKMSCVLPHDLAHFLLSMLEKTALGFISQSIGWLHSMFWMNAISPITFCIAYDLTTEGLWQLQKASCYFHLQTNEQTWSCITKSSKFNCSKARPLILTIAFTITTIKSQSWKQIFALVHVLLLHIQSSETRSSHCQLFSTLLLYSCQPQTEIKFPSYYSEKHFPSLSQHMLLFPPTIFVPAPGAAPQFFFELHLEQGRAQLSQSHSHSSLQAGSHYLFFSLNSVPHTVDTVDYFQNRSWFLLFSFAIFKAYIVMHSWYEHSIVQTEMQAKYLGFQMFPHFSAHDPVNETFT